MLGCTLRPEAGQRRSRKRSRRLMSSPTGLTQSPAAPPLAAGVPPPTGAGRGVEPARPRLPGLYGLALLIFVTLFGVLVLGVRPGALLASADNPAGVLVLLLGIGGAGAFAINRWGAWSLAGAALVLEDQPVRRALRRGGWGGGGRAGRGVG